MSSCVLFWKPFVQLVTYALQHDFCSQILVVPFISSYLVYIERDRVFKVTRYAPAAGISATLAGLAIGWWAARSFDQTAAHGWLSVFALSILLVWFGAFVTCYGLAAARAAAFPLLFLLLMIPPPDFLLTRIVHCLQEGSTEVSSVIFRALGTPVFRQGFVLAVPGVRIEVAQECSSIRSSVALFITCLLAGHLFLRRTWKTALLVALSLPLSVIKNGIRISTLTLLSIYVDPAFLHGSLHRDGGFVFFLIALVLIYPVFRLLEKAERERTLAVPEVPVGLHEGSANS